MYLYITSDVRPGKEIQNASQEIRQAACQQIEQA
jgi:hypothetical protein